MTSKEIRKKYLDFFKEKGHAVVLSSSIIPENDPTTLFTGSGMQPMVPYLLGEKHPAGSRLVDVQKCFRAEDMEEVGDNRHTTFFEMLGNWSLGDYFKEEQISWMFEFLTKEIELDPNKLYVTVFRGNEELGIPKDTEAVAIWKGEFFKMGIEAKDVDFAEKDGMQGGRIFYYNEKKNWWSRVGVPANMPVGEPGGPDSEMFWDFGADLELHENSEFKNDPCHVNCDCGRFLEIGNNVFMQYIKTDKGFELLPKGNIDFGGGLERIVAAKKDNPDIFKTDLFAHIIHLIEELSGKKYSDSRENKRAMRIIADHLKAATFIMGDDKGFAPSNTGQGYLVRRLVRRSIMFGRQMGITEKAWIEKVAEIVAEEYSKIYPEIEKNFNFIISNLKKEEEKFNKTLETGLKEFEKLEHEARTSDKIINGADAFNLYQTYGFPIEITMELANEFGLAINKDEFDIELKKHQELSRASSSGMFKGGLADTGEQTKKLHTATHMLNAALRKILGSHVYQKGSNITAERLRFDFSHPEKLSSDQLKQVEGLINNKIKENLPVTMTEMDLQEAKKSGAIGVFESKYDQRVKVYTIGDPSKGSEIFSAEVCGGPHVNFTGELGHFKIMKEEAVSAGVRRIKAVLE